MANNVRTPVALMNCNTDELPQSPAHIVEWFSRLQKTYGGRPFEEKNATKRFEIELGFNLLTESEIVSVAKEYGITHFLSKEPNNKNFPEIWKDKQYTLYYLGSNN